MIVVVDVPEELLGGTDTITLGGGGGLEVSSGRVPEGGEGRACAGLEVTGEGDACCFGDGLLVTIGEGVGLGLAVTGTVAGDEVMLGGGLAGTFPTGGGRTEGGLATGSGTTGLGLTLGGNVNTGGFGARGSEPGGGEVVIANSFRERRPSESLSTSACHMNAF